ncbi:MAG: TonB-dependent receptor, partial [Verrucomicrobiota bacterium]|nr:TonB-dependent receptor [Verrucomicrobiota bacterium]
ELPIAQEMLTLPKVLTGSDNALFGFNSTAGTISYGWNQIQDRGQLTIGGGNHKLNYQRIHRSLTGALGESNDWSWGFEAETSRSESAGSIQNGDHDFNRLSSRLQMLGPKSQTDFFAGYQDKFFGWPGMYTATRFADPVNLTLSPEYENLKTRLFIINHRQDYGIDSSFELTATHRLHTDKYLLDASAFTSPFKYIANHETEASSLALNGFHRFKKNIGLNYAAQFTDDNIKSSSLEQGNFKSRSYSKISLLPEYLITLNNDENLTIRAGASHDDSNRDDYEFSFIGDVDWKRVQDDKMEQIYLSYSEANKVPGYTAIGGSKTSGIFRSEHNLGRESSQNLELGASSRRTNWSLRGAIFYRRDKDLTDWTYSNNDTYARSATGVDIETFGVELIASKRWNTIEAITSYSHLSKEEDYGDDSIDASFYALNYAKHRFTLGAIWSPSDTIEVRIDNEWRQNQENSLRLGSDSALFTHIGLSIYPPQFENLELFFAIDNAWDDDFQDVPGTPGRGDQYSVGSTLRW